MEIAISVAEATEYISNHYTTMNPLRVNWSILTDGSVDENKNDKQCYVNQSIDEISALIFKVGTPEAIIKNAVAENALAIMDKDINAKSDMQFKALQSMGEQKNTRYNRREQGDVVGINTAGIEQRIPITGAKAYAMLRLYIGGSFNIL